MTGVAHYSEFKGSAAPVAVAIAKTPYMWLNQTVIIAILAGYTSVMLVMLMGQSRIFYTMSNDGLIPKAFGDLHPRYKTPYKANWILFVFVGLFAAFVPGHVAGDLTSFGTLFAFVLVSLGVWIMRRKAPNMARPFKTPWVPVVPILGAVVCTFMIGAIDIRTLKFALVWMLIGLVVYFAYSRKKSKLENPGEILPKASDFN
jgi:APA family basic amino acid/polyamine antiporter